MQVLVLLTLNVKSVVVLRTKYLLFFLFKKYPFSHPFDFTMENSLSYGSLQATTHQQIVFMFLDTTESV